MVGEVLTSILPLTKTKHIIIADKNQIPLESYFL